MKNITEEQYKQFQDLKRWAKKERVFQSVSSIANLEDDIDLPIKKCVAMFALLGLEPLFSCCGFDYKGQPYHKSHQYGNPYFMFKYNERTRDLPDCKFPNGWTASVAHRKTTVFLQMIVQGNPHWRRRECIHFSEEITLGIAWLESWLMSGKSRFLDEVIIYDTNQNYKKNDVRFWQYEPKNPWKVKKELIDTY